MSEEHYKNKRPLTRYNRAQSHVSTDTNKNNKGVYYNSLGDDYVVKC